MSNSKKKQTMRLTAKEWKRQLNEDRLALLDMPFRRRTLPDVVYGNWVVVADRQRGKSCALAQLVYQRTQRRRAHPICGSTQLFVLLLRNEIYRRFSGRELVEALLPLLTDDVRLLCLDDVDLVDGWPELLAALAEQKVQVFVTMSHHAAQKMVEYPVLQERFRVHRLSDFDLREFLYVSNRNCDKMPNPLIRWGSYPAVLLSSGNRTERLQQLFRTLFYEELLPRYNVRNEEAVRSLLHLLAEHLGDELSYNGLCRMLQDKGLKVGVTTVAEYVAILQEMRIIRTIPCRTESTGRMPKQRYWFYDNGVLSLFLPKTHLWKTLTRNAMAQSVFRSYRDHKIYCVSLRNATIDFLIPECDSAVVLCPNDEAVPDAVRNLRRFNRKYPTVHKYICTCKEVSAALPQNISNWVLHDWRLVLRFQHRKRSPELDAPQRTMYEQLIADQDLSPK